MEQNIAEQIMYVINEIAEKLGIAAEKLYPMLRRQAMIDGYINIFYVVIVGIVSFLLYKAVYICYIEKDEASLTLADRNNWDISHVVFWLIWISTLITCILCTLVSITSIINIFCNPDWYIINNILKKLIT